MDITSPLPKRSVVLDYGYDPSLTPVIRAVADGLQTHVHQHMEISLIPPDALLVACYADARQHHMILPHQARGGACLFVNHDMLNVGNRLHREEPVTSGRINLYQPSPTFWPGNQPDAEQILKSKGIQLAPWKTEGNIMLACPPKAELVPFLETWTDHLNPRWPFRMSEWVANVKTAAAEANLKLVWRTRDDTTPLTEHLQQAALVATVQSSVGPQALAMGIPTLGVADLCPVGSAVGCTNWHNPRRSGRVAGRVGVLAEIVASQFSLEQLRTPEYLKIILARQHHQHGLAHRGGWDGPEAGTVRVA